MNGEPPDPGGRALRPECCPVCSSGLVEPIYWAQLDRDRWRLELRCPECETKRTAVFDAATVHAYSIILYEAADEVAKQVRALHAGWSADRACDEERFVEALRADLILPIDF